MSEPIPGTIGSLGELIEAIGTMQIEIEAPGATENDPPVGGRMFLAYLAQTFTGFHIGPTAPADASLKPVWFSTDDSDVGLYFNIQSDVQLKASDPIWFDPLQPGPEGAPGSNIVDIPTQFGEPYPTSRRLGGKTLYAIRLGGVITGSETLTVPSVVSAAWDVNSVHIQVGDSYRVNSGVVAPISDQSTGSCNYLFDRSTGELNILADNESLEQEHVVVLQYTLA